MSPTLLCSFGSNVSNKVSMNVIQNCECSSALPNVLIECPRTLKNNIRIEYRPYILTPVLCTNVFIILS